MFEEKSQKKPLSTPGNITYEMIKKLYQPFIDSSSSEEEINQNELSQLEYKPSGFDDNVINLPVNNAIKLSSDKVKLTSASLTFPSVIEQTPSLTTTT